VLLGRSGGRARVVHPAIPGRAPHLYHALRCFCLGAFAALQRGVDDGEEIPFAFEEHGGLGRPALYEYKPLVRGFVESRADDLAGLDDARLAAYELRREPAARIFARAHAGPAADEDHAIHRSVLVPLLVATAEASGGFDWKDDAFDRAYNDLEQSLFRERHGYAAVAPLIGVSAGGEVELGGGIRVRAAATGEIAAHWPEAQGLLPPSFGREPDRLCVLELEATLEREAREAPDAPAELADAVTAVRLATAAPVAAGPVIFERLDWRPYGIRPMVPIAATQPNGEPTRLDRFRGGVAARLRDRLGLADDDPRLAEALDRWELSLFQADPFRSEQLRESLAALLGGGDGLAIAVLRAAVLLGDAAHERTSLLERLRALAAGRPAEEAAADAVRRALVEVLLDGDRRRVVATLDETLLGARAAPETRRDVGAVA
jgi:hypothetical protein